MAWTLSFNSLFEILGFATSAIPPSRRKLSILFLRFALEGRRVRIVESDIPFQFSFWDSWDSAQKINWGNSVGTRGRLSILFLRFDAGLPFAGYPGKIRELSILFLRFWRGIAGWTTWSRSGSLSILFLRFMASLWGRSPRAFWSFNSLFEIPGQDRDRLQVAERIDRAFNSLFEIHLMDLIARENDPETFNSLFEIHISRIFRWAVETRCSFQFSFWDSALFFRPPSLN